MTGSVVNRRFKLLLYVICCFLWSMGSIVGRFALELMLLGSKTFESGWSGTGTGVLGLKIR